ncbi:TPA: ABC transporter ATP-binding protein [Legionella pneumophila]|nr:ABC transporter ATP-binding protein [Legionella pneumophila]HAT2066017.1 ABC transporter ATP-binding protein [Legionella pneumophila]HCR5121521.1 ABC transporter ATP-binding protein [Legionella pneumophila]HCR5124431.1 ABC transporter ATP-binding protein [Legionella pneumophila]HCR5127161.1 ABC transporter ATP-binding protein [Legionella pneumophila]HCR5130226.1 ABC transporter ATP-binding protein [Legionella pneumophila]
MNSDNKKSEELPKTLGRFFWHFIKKQPLAFTVFFVAPIAMVLENNAIPYSLKMIIDALGGHSREENIFSVVAPALWLGGGAWLALIVILRLQNWWQGYVIPRFQADVRMSVMEYLSRQSYHYFSNQMAGGLANKVNDLPRALDSIFNIITWYAIAAFASIIVALILMCTINYWFAVILLSWIIFQLYISYRLSKKVDQYAKENAEDKSQLSGKIVDSLSNASVVKLFARSRDELAYISASQNMEVQSNKKLTIYMNIFRLYLDIPVTVMLVAMVYFLLTFWNKKLITTGDLVFIFNVSFSIMTQIWYLCHAIAEFFREIGIARQAIALLSAPIEVEDAPDAKPLIVKEGKIEFDSVTFHYNQGKKVFENKSVIIKPKQRVGLVGFSGSGKTTFIHLILRLFNVESGKILIDGQDISQVSQDSLRSAISLIPQDTTLFHRTLMENIRYGNPDATDDEVVMASKQACCDDFISLLPDGYNTLVGERGIKLSGGQRQRIAIARAILKNTKILILDEATSQLDSLTEEAIQNSLWQLMESKTTIVIAHRLSTLLHMDRILVFEAGKIIEDGTHEELLAKDGLYKSMWDAQVGGFLPESDRDRDNWDE